MGVTGLWRLVEPSGKPVPLETLENKVLAVDVSIWLHQAIKGFQDAQGGPLPNAHLLGIYHRVCKLLYFRIKPVFVFDGGVPNLKKETISKRQQQKSKKLNEAERIQKQLLTTLLKHSAVNKVLSETAIATLVTKPNLSKLANKEKADDIYKLPPTDFDSTLSSDEDTSGSVSSSPSKHWDLHTIDEKSPHFKSLPADVRHEILTELKETRKQSSWGRLHELPKQSDDFSGFQMKRLLKRNSVQVSLEEAEKEMGGRSLSLAELETLLKDQGVVTSSNSLGTRIASDENTRYLLIKDVKKAMNEASNRKSPALESITEEEEKSNESKSSGQDIEKKSNESKSSEQEMEKDFKLVEVIDSVQNDEDQKIVNNSDSEFQRDLEKAIQLSLQDLPSTSKDESNEKAVSTKRKHNFSFLENFDDADFQSSSESEDSDCHKNINKVLASAKSYMMEYSGLTPSEIAKIIGGNVGSTKSKSNSSKTQSPENSKSSTSPVIVSKTSSVECTISVEENGESKLSSKQLLIEDSEDRTVSSSTTKTLQTQVINIPIESSEVTSSTSKDNGVPLKINNSEIPINSTTTDESVEVMSDASSESADDFLEVSDISVNNHDKSKKFEILIKPEDALEDDLFSDIFCDKKDGNSIATSTNNGIIQINTNSKESRSVTKVPIIEPVVSSSDNSKPTEIVPKLDVEPLIQETEITNNVDSDASTEKKVDKEIIENKVTKEDQTKNVIAEFIKPQVEISKTSEFQEEVERQILTAEQLKEMEANLQQEEAELISERLSKERMASNLTEQIYQEAQELLQLFGVPYIVAPMEAEAQCAFLDDINLTDGTITDDSDIWLFGGRTVYKNFFNQHKVVMEYRAENILHHFKLSREQMILLALLVGSDYTVGIQGIGPVTALEVLAAFPPSKSADQQLISGLTEFRRWLSGERAVGPGRTTLRNKLKNVALTESFPSVQVVRAYLEPTVDSSREPFTWAKPDTAGLIEFARRKFGWPRHKSEEILKPVLKQLNENRIQKSIKDYFQTKRKIDSGEAEAKMSKRVKKAINRIEKGDTGDSDEDKNKTKTRKKRNPKTKKATKLSKDDDSKESAVDATKTVSDDVTEIAGFSSDEDIQILKKTHTESKKKLQQIKKEVKIEIEQQAKKPRPTASLHKKDIIPQKEKDKVDALRSKMKAIEVFRKSKKGPGFVTKRKQAVRKPKEDAELSESSNSCNSD